MKILLTLITFTIVSCSSSKEVIKNFSENIESVYFQKWVSGIEEGGSGIKFYLNFKEPLSKEFKLRKVSFQSHPSIFEKISETDYIAKIDISKRDYILGLNPVDEYGNQEPDRKDNYNDAFIFYEVNNKKYMIRILNVKEKPMIAYPSMNKSKN